MKLRALITLGLLALLASPAPAQIPPLPTLPAGPLDLSFPVNIADVTGVRASIFINDSEIPIVVEMAQDPSTGKYSCVAGGCTVGGEVVEAKGKLKPKPLGDGQVLWYWSGSLKSPKGTAKEKKVKVTLKGEVTSGVFDFSYKGPAGKQKLFGHPVDILGNIGTQIASVSISPEILKPGKFGGSGVMTLGTSTDTFQSGPLKVSISPCKLTVNLKVGKRKLVFKAAREGDSWNGTLKVIAKPIKQIGALVLPADGIFATPLGCGDPKPSKPPACGEKLDVAWEGATVVMTAQMYANSGEFINGTLSLFRTAGGNILGSGGLSANGLDISTTQNCLPVDFNQVALGEWFCMSAEAYDIETHTTNRYGTLCFSVDTLTPRLEGEYVLLNSRGNAVSGGSGRWTDTQDICGDWVGDVVQAEVKSEDPQVFGSFSVSETTRGRAASWFNVTVGQQSYDAFENCIDMDPTQLAPGGWFAMDVTTWNPSTGMSEEAGKVHFDISEVAPFLRGTWSLVDPGDNPIHSGVWSVSESFVCGYQETNDFFFDLTGFDDSISGGNVSGGRTSEGKFWVQVNASGPELNLWAETLCLDVGLEDITVGDWFSVEVMAWDNSANAWVPFGTLSFKLDSILPIPSGSWDLRDVNGTTLTSGSWSPPSF